MFSVEEGGQRATHIPLVRAALAVVDGAMKDDSRISAVGSDTWVTGSIPSKSSRLLLIDLHVLLHVL